MKALQLIMDYAGGNKEFPGTDVLEKAKKELEKLEEDRRFLLALQNAGVDNWEGYDFALDELEEEL